MELRVACVLQGLRRGADVVVGTPGRIKDLMERKVLKLTEVRCVQNAKMTEFR